MPTSTAKPRTVSPYLRRLMKMTETPSIRNALRRAANPSGYAGALRYLPGPPASTKDVPNWVFLYISDFATYEHARHKAGDTFGRMARHAVNAGILVEGTARQRLSVVQNMPLATAHRTLTSLLIIANQHVIPVDWDDLRRLYENWDHPDRTIQQNTRWSILEDFETG